ncbi:MAG: hypothetical protein KDD10_11475 [Phaeodactylibacter sp.]|nr:hypothetical protein [Phaeodactylibacter sp.]
MSPQCGLRVRRYRHSAEEISQSVSLYANTAIGFRLSAAVYRHGHLAGASTNAFRAWVFRIGYYLLKKKSYSPAIEWAWVLDHTIQIGAYRCLAIIGIDLGQCRQEGQFNVGPQHLHLLDVYLSSDWAWSEVEKRLAYCYGHCGKLPVQILSDGGKDLRGAIEAFQQLHCPVASSQDITHYAAQALKELLQGCAQWKGLVKAVNTARRKSFQTKLAHLMPAGLRKWSRFLNLDACIESLSKCLAFFDSGPGLSLLGAAGKHKEAFAPMLAMKGYILQVSQAMKIINGLLRLFKQKGISRRAVEELQPETLEGQNPQEWGTMAWTVYDKMKAFLQQQAQRLPDDDKPYLAHTDMIESLFGAYKQKMKVSWLSSFTESVLAMPVLLGGLDAETVREALSQTRQEEIQQWFATMVPEGSLLKQRRAAFSAGKQNCGNSSNTNTS